MASERNILIKREVGVDNDRRLASFRFTIRTKDSSKASQGHSSCPSLFPLFCSLYLLLVE
jgi:hypothetical protein